MNKDQMQGTTREIIGRFQKNFGEVFGNQFQKEKGCMNEIAGKSQKSLGDIKEFIAKK
ncbi:CsbD family protein [Undibacterium sp. SXout7W]|uniref:CsbD family protein n=1 Tax=Undibacterium sp. SXout7W TaxID=3413049 RepID=UPI003BF192A6